MTLHLFGDINPFEISARYVRQALAEVGDVDAFEFFLHSNGGDIAEGFSIYHQILAHPARVTGHVQAVAASMAGIVLMAADEIHIAENGFLVFHNPFVPMIGGESQDLRRTADLLDAFKANAIRAYQRHSQLSADEISELMDVETWLTAEEAVEKGFAHTVSGRIETTQHLDLSRFERLPSAARAFHQTSSGGPMAQPEIPTPEALPEPGSPEALAEETPPEAPAEETPETLWNRLGRLLLRRTAKEDESPEARLTPAESTAVLDLERRALRHDRARFHLERDLAPHRATVEPAQLTELEPILLKLKTAELAGDPDAAAQYQSLCALLPSLASPKAGPPLATSDADALVAGLEISEERRALDERRGITDERRQALLRKYPGCRPGAALSIR